MFVTPRAFNLKEGDKTEESLMFDTDRIFVYQTNGNKNYFRT